MNPPSPDNPREQMEVRIVAFLLGEASPFEAGEIQQALAQDQALAAFHDEMRRTIGLVTEASRKFSAGAQPAAAAEPKLSPERRAALLARFRGAPPTPAEPEKIIPLAPPAPWRMRWFVPASMAALAVGLLALAATLLLPMSRSRVAMVSSLSEGTLNAEKHRWHFARNRNAHEADLALAMPAVLASPDGAEKKGLDLSWSRKPVRVTPLPGRPASPPPATPPPAAAHSPMAALALPHAAAEASSMEGETRAPQFEELAARGEETVAAARNESLARKQPSDGENKWFAKAAKQAPSSKPGATSAGNVLALNVEQAPAGAAPAGVPPPVAAVASPAPAAPGATTLSVATSGASRKLTRPNIVLPAQLADTDGDGARSPVGGRSGLATGDYSGVTRDSAGELGFLAAGERSAVTHDFDDMAAVAHGRVGGEMPAFQGPARQPEFGLSRLQNLPETLAPAVQPPPPPSGPATLAPLAVKLPMPSFKGTPDDLPKSDHIEPLAETRWADASSQTANKSGFFAYQSATAASQPSDQKLSAGLSKEARDVSGEGRSAAAQDKAAGSFALEQQNKNTLTYNTELYDTELAKARKSSQEAGLRESAGKQIALGVENQWGMQIPAAAPADESKRRSGIAGSGPAKPNEPMPGTTDEPVLLIPDVNQLSQAPGYASAGTGLAPAKSAFSQRLGQIARRDQPNVGGTVGGMAGMGGLGGGGGGYGGGIRPDNYGGQLGASFSPQHGAAPDGKPAALGVIEANLEVKRESENLLLAREDMIHERERLDKLESGRAVTGLSAVEKSETAQALNRGEMFGAVATGKPAEPAVPALGTTPVLGRFFGNANRSGSRDAARDSGVEKKLPEIAGQPVQQDSRGEGWQAANANGPAVTPEGLALDGIIAGNGTRVALPKDSTAAVVENGDSVQEFFALGDTTKMQRSTGGNGVVKGYRYSVSQDEARKAGGLVTDTQGLKPRLAVRAPADVGLLTAPAQEREAVEFQAKAPASKTTPIALPPGVAETAQDVGGRSDRSRELASLDERTVNAADALAVSSGPTSADRFFRLKQTTKDAKQEAKSPPTATTVSAENKPVAAGGTVYSVNAVGYTDLHLPAGFSLVTNAAPMSHTFAKTEAMLADPGRDVASLEALRDKMQMQIVAQEVESKIPKSMVVELVDPAQAQPATSPTLGTRLRQTLSGQVDRVARIQVEKDTPVVGGLNRNSTSVTVTPAYDPYWVQTESEQIQSKAVLGKVIEKLKLNDTWAAGRGKAKLSTDESYQLLKKQLDIRPSKGTSVIEIHAKSEKPEEAARLANAVAEAYGEVRREKRREVTERGVEVVKQQLAEQEQKLAKAKDELARSEKESAAVPPAATAPKAEPDRPAARPATPPPVPQPEVLTRENAFSTFSLNVSDVSFKLAEASFQNGAMPDPGSIRVEEFLNAFRYRDPAPAPGARLAFAWDRARYPFAHNRDVLRLAVQTAARGREAQRPLNLVILLDNSGSMERPDRVQILHEALQVLAKQLRPQDRISVIAFARTARLWVDGMAGGHSQELLSKVLNLNPEGGTNLEDAMNLGYTTATKHFVPNGVNRVILLTDGAANLGNVEPQALKDKVVAERKKGIALDCFGIGWEGYNDDLLEVLASNGDGRYGFLNTPEDAAPEFADQLAGALNVAAADVKTQVEFNPDRVTSWRQIGYAKHQLTKEQFRDNTVDAAEIAAAEQGNALYVIETNPQGSGPLGVVRVRFKVPETGEYIEQEWPLPYQAKAPALDQASPAMRLAVTASAFGEWLSRSPFAAPVTPGALQSCLAGVPEAFAPDPRPQRLALMIRQAQGIAGN